jgi:Uma2 family endonuclease
MLATKVQYTFADLLKQAPDDYNIYDILGGDLVVWTSPADPHAAVVSELLDLCRAAQRGGYGWARTAPRAVAFDFPEHGVNSMDVTHPDVLFVTTARRNVMGHQCVEAAPDLVIEVLSPSTRADDLPGGRKFAIYERYGVAHYWIVDTDARTITQYAWHEGRLHQSAVLTEADTLSSPLFPSITRPVREIFSAIL